jgi:hypothetical protein
MCSSPTRCNATNEPGDWHGEGDAWVARNRRTWRDCGLEVTLSHWDDWRGHPEFPAVLEQFRAAAGGELLGRALDHDATAFVARQAGKGLPATVEQSRAYLLEELAVIALEARAYPGARIYPGPELECFRVASGLVAGVPRGLERQYHTAIDFKRRRQSPEPTRAVA